MKTIPIEQFGRDHWSVFAYIEALCVDRLGVPDKDRMRTNPKRHPALVGLHMIGYPWKNANSTRLAGHIPAHPVQCQGHDDWDCVDDLWAAGLIRVFGTGINPVYQLTDLGGSVAARLRQHKASGGSFSNFVLNQKL